MHVCTRGHIPRDPSREKTGHIVRCVVRLGDADEVVVRRVEGTSSSENPGDLLA